MEGGWIEVSAGRDGDHLVLQVRDSGVGLGPAGSTGAATSGTRFGLAQVRERLATLHGTRANFTLQAAEDAEGGVVARIALPLTTGLQLGA